MSTAFPTDSLSRRSASATCAPAVKPATATAAALPVADIRRDLSRGIIDAFYTGRTPISFKSLVSTARKLTGELVDTYGGRFGEAAVRTEAAKAFRDFSRDPAFDRTYGDLYTLDWDYTLAG